MIGTASGFSDLRTVALAVALAFVHQYHHRHRDQGSHAEQSA
ncbi:MAG TPA: hypothetical protein VGR11_14195 [Solirubrobacteraceae bacterium]|nr:hypothetical protein [Solirubrobacteraceae bacterium]